MRTPSIRSATLSDIDCLLALETDSFASDRLTSRSFRHFVRSPTAVLRVMHEGAKILGYYLLLFRARSEVARLYSIAVDGPHRGRGLAAALLADAEHAAERHGLARLSLEVRDDNAAIRLYERLGYGLKGRIAEYYADGGVARRYEKRLDRPAGGRQREADD
jgi:ribosomal protein S18 acetylase RimI-like enzyme